MSHTVPSAPLTDAALIRLDHLIAEVRDSQDGNAELLLEHLQSARTSLLGAMPDEYEFSLVTAMDLAHQATNAALRKSIREEVKVLLDQLPAARPQTPPITSRLTSRPGRDSQTLEETGKSELYRFFRGRATTLGVFYPTHYIFASFASLENARNAAKALRAAGCTEVVATSGAETFRFMAEIRSEAGLWGALMASISRFFGTEEVFADIDLAKLEQGAAFLAVYCPREEQADLIRDAVVPFEPLAMQLYLPGGIRSLVAGTSPGPQGNHPERN